MSDIPLSQKHGLNPSMSVCFWCGEEDGAIALMGRLPNDVEAPRRVVTSYDPCAQCVENRALGITLIEMDSTNVPTGRWVVVKEAVLTRIVNDAELLVNIMRTRMAHMGTDVFEMLMADQL